MAGRTKQIVAALVVAAAVAAAAVSYGLTRGETSSQALRWRGDSCRDAVADPRFAGPISGARPLVDRMKAAFAAPGLQVAVAVDGKIVWSRFCGYADVANRTPTTATTLFRVGSVSKAFTAAALARLVQAGKIDLGAEVQEYVPSFPRKSEPITIAQLAAHQSGIRHYGGTEALSTVHYDSVSESLRIFAGDPLLFRPGSDHSYSSYGFNVLGAALEGAAGAGYVDVLREEVLSPLGLTRTENDVEGLTVAPRSTRFARIALPARRRGWISATAIRQAGSSRPRRRWRGSGPSSATPASSVGRRRRRSSPSSGPRTGRLPGTASATRWPSRLSAASSATPGTSSAAPPSCSPIRGRASRSR